MSDDEYEQATPEQKLNIANYFVMSSPTGEVHEVLYDVSKLVADPDVMSDENVRKIMKDYNNEQLQPAKTPDGNNVVVSPYGAVDDDLYLDPSSGKVLRFDHRKHQFTEETDKRQDLDATINAYRTAIEKAMKDYEGRQYKADKCVTTVYGADDGNLTVCLSARNVHLPAFWTGGWRTTCTINVGTKGSTDMKCSNKVNVHYFEDGNVQLHSAIEKTVSVNVQDEASTAENVVKALQGFESDFQSNMEEMYVDMHNTTFKKMRRFLPITKQPMNWNVHAHGLIGSK